MPTRFPLAPAALALLAAAPPLAAQNPERHVLRGADVAIYDPAGRVQVVAGSGSDVVVEVTRRGRDAARLRVLDDAVDGRPTLRVVAPDRDLVYPDMGRGSSATLRVEPNGTFDGNSGDDDVTRLRIRGEGSGPEAWADVVVRVPARARVQVKLGAGSATARDVDGDVAIGTFTGDVTTERTRGRLAVSSGSGRALVRDATGDAVRVSAGSGNAEVQDVRADRIGVSAGSGDVRGGNVTASEGSFNVGSGSLAVDGVRVRTLRAGSGSGDLELGLAGDMDEARVGAGSGRVTLRVPANFGATLDVTTGSGELHSDLPLQATRLERHHVTGRIGDGKAQVRVSAGSGDVRVVPSR